MTTAATSPAVRPENQENPASAEPPPASSVTNEKPKALPKKKKKKKVLVTPSTVADNHRMHVDKHVVDELLLVCGVIGTTTAEGNRIVPVTDCLNWLQDLQRALRRDDDLYRPISLLLGQWKVVPHKLLPLVWSCRYDTPLVLTVVKILVILTKPLAPNTVRAGRMVIDSSSGKVSGAVVQEQIKLRENALAQADIRMEYKKALCYHESHLDEKKKKGKKGKKGDEEKKGGGLLSIFVSLLAEPLSKAGSARTDQDHLTIELVLHLFRNLLSAEPLLTTSAEAQHRASILHKDMIALFDRELVLEIFLVLGSDMEQRENQPYNLLLMELIHHLIKNEDPTAVAKSSLVAAAATSDDNSSKSQPSRPPLLKERREQQSLRTASLMTSRHSQFGGTLMVQRMNGQRQYVSSTAAYARLGDGGGPSSSSCAPVAKRKNKKTEAFIGNGRTLQTHTRGLEADRGPSAMRAQKALDSFCHRFVKECYGPVMKSIKNEFRRDSVRLEDGDRVVFFRLVWFFCQWWRASGKKVLLDDADDEAKSKSALGQLIFTMDVFTFNLVLNATDTFVEHKKHARLAQTVALLSEMLHLLHVMYTSKEPTEHLMAMGLLDRLYYCGDPLDRLPNLLSKWKPGVSTREYLCDLVEVNYMTLKMLELHSKACKGADTKVAKKRDTASKFKAAAANFDVQRYFFNKIVKRDVVSMYTHLLSQYAVNSPHVNHRIVAFFLSVSKFTITAPENNDPDFPLAEKTVTLEAMLYNVPLLTVLNSILNDSNFRHDKPSELVVNYAADLVHKFSMAAKENPMLFVEAMLRQNYPSKFCEFAGNMYVTEELRLIAERDFLLEGQQEDDEQADAAPRQEEDSDDDEEELELDDFGVTGGTTPTKKAKRRKRRPKKKVVLDSDSDSDDDDLDAGDKEKEKNETPADEEVKSKAEGTAEDSDSDMAWGGSEQQSKKKQSSDSDSEDSTEGTNESAQTEKAGNSQAGKRKRLLGSDSESGSSDEELEPATKSLESTKTSPAKKARVFNDDDDSSDDDDE